MPLYAKILKSEIEKITTAKETVRFIDLLNSNKELDNKFKNHIKKELEKWVNKTKTKIIEEYKELFDEDEIEMDSIDSDEVLEEFNNEDPIKNIIDNFVDGLEQDGIVVNYSDIIDRIFTNYYDELINNIETIFKNSTKTSQLEINALNEVNFITQLNESTEKSQKMNELLLKKLDIYLNSKLKDWISKIKPDVETVLDDFIKETITKDFIFDNFKVEIGNLTLDKLQDYIYNSFDDLWDKIDSRIEDELKNPTKTSQLEIKAMDTIGFVKKLNEDFDMKQKMNKILSKKLDTYLDKKSEDWTFEHDPDVETVLDEFIKEIITKEYILDNFQTKINDVELDNLLDYVYNSFDDLYDEIDSRIEDEKNGRDNTKSPFGPGMGQHDFI